MRENASLTEKVAQARLDLAHEGVLACGRVDLDGDDFLLIAVPPERVRVRGAVRACVDACPA